MGVYRHCCCMHRWRCGLWRRSDLFTLKSETRAIANEILFYCCVCGFNRCADANAMLVLSRCQTLSLTSYSMQFNYAIFPQVDNFPDQRWCSTLNKKYNRHLFGIWKCESMRFLPTVQISLLPPLPLLLRVCVFVFYSTRSFGSAILWMCDKNATTNGFSKRAFDSNWNWNEYVNAGKTMHLSLITHILNTMCGC